MSRKHFTALLVIAVAAVFMVACCEDWDKQKCMDEHGLIEPPINPPSTPIIILGLRPIDGAVEWSYDGNAQGNSTHTMFVDDESCDLRADFIGSKLIQFVYLPENETDWNNAQPAKKIVAKNSDIKMVITRNGIFGARYYIEDKTNPSSPRLCTADASLPIETGDVPKELYELEFNELIHVDGTVETKVEKVKIQPYVLIE
jgi:hypothetical protein